MEKRGKTGVSLIHNLEEGVVLAITDDGRVIGAYGSAEEARLKMAVEGVEPYRTINMNWKQLTLSESAI